VPVDFVVVEATGGLETPIASAPTAAGIAVAICAQPGGALSGDEAAREEEEEKK
jgi:hypothetical protein